MLDIITADCPEELEQTLKDIVCSACDGAKGSGEKCDWRHNNQYCDVVQPTVEAIHKAYWDYQVKELKRSRK